MTKFSQCKILFQGLRKNSQKYFVESSHFEGKENKRFFPLDVFLLVLCLLSSSYWFVILALRHVVFSGQSNLACPACAFFMPDSAAHVFPRFMSITRVSHTWQQVTRVFPPLTAVTRASFSTLGSSR